MASAREPWLERVRSIPLFLGSWEYGSKKRAELEPMMPSTHAL